MKLFNYLNTTNWPCQNDLFMRLLLERLSIMEALASIKFKQRAVEDCQRELTLMAHLQNRCLSSGYSIKKTEIVLSVFSENICLAKCIQIACFHEWEMMSIEKVKVMGFISARTIISNQLSNQMLLPSLRDYITYKTNAMFDALRFLKKSSELNNLMEPLTSCFPRINQAELGGIITGIMKSMTKLTSLST